jgi:hypothetical protein
LFEGIESEARVERGRHDLTIESVMTRGCVMMDGVKTAATTESETRAETSRLCDGGDGGEAVAINEFEAEAPGQLTMNRDVPLGFGTMCVMAATPREFAVDFAMKKFA